MNKSPVRHEIHLPVDSEKKRDQKANRASETPTPEKQFETLMNPCKSYESFTKKEVSDTKINSSRDHYDPSHKLDDIPKHNDMSPSLIKAPSLIKVISLGLDRNTPEPEEENDIEVQYVSDEYFDQPENNLRVGEGECTHKQNGKKMCECDILMTKQSMLSKMVKSLHSFTNSASKMKQPKVVFGPPKPKI